MKFLYKFIILGLTGLFLSGCSLVPTAWRSSRPGGEVQPAPTALPAEASAEVGGPTQTMEQLDADVTADLETEMDADLKQIDADLKAIDEEAGNY